MVSLTGHKVYLDASTVIYALEGVSQYANLQAGLLVPLDKGLFNAVTSEITLVETIFGPRKAGDKNAEQELRRFLTSSVRLAVEPITMALLERVIDLRAQHGLKIPDAVHLATGISAGCDLFVTGDQAWSRVGVVVVDPVDIA